MWFIAGSPFLAAILIGLWAAFNDCMTIPEGEE